MVIILIVD